MTTKDQERKALEQIRKIVDGLGKGSYIATAFEGCFEIAEDNIGNDFACSMKQRLETSEKENAGLIKSIAEYQNKVKSLEMKAKNYEDLRLKKEEYKQSALENWNKFRDAEDKLEAAELEIMKLKAKLFDLIVKEV